MSEMRNKKAIDATIVNVDPDLDPIPATIVSDSRDHLGQRLGKLAIALLLMFFATSAYIQAAHNGNLLSRAAKDRSHLVDVNKKLARTNAQEVRLIKDLQTTLASQNKALRKAGFRTIVIPGVKLPSTPSTKKNGSGEIHKPPAYPPSSQPTPRPTHSSSKPTPRPKPKPTPTSKDIICTLTGICLNGSSYDHQQQTLRRTQVSGSDHLTGTWYVIFSLISDLGAIARV